ncbi:MAG: hypothetical protein V3V36_02055, partial [Candidatus Hydrothermarchaeaceae archaeon]
PSALPIVRLNIKEDKRRVPKSRKTQSRQTSFLVAFTGRTMAHRPRIRHRLKMFEPTTFATAIFPIPLSAALRETANSGADVPKATMVSPITS